MFLVQYQEISRILSRDGICKDGVQIAAVIVSSER